MLGAWMEHLGLPPCEYTRSSVAGSECMRVRGDGADSPDRPQRRNREVQDASEPHRFVTAVGISWSTEF